MTHSELEASLKKGTIPDICFLYGDESFLVERSTRLILDRAIDPSLKDFNFNVFYGNESKGIDILDAAQTLPMFAERRAVLVKRTENLSATACDALLPYILRPSPSTCLVFTGSKIDQRKKFFLELKKHAVLVEHKRLYDNKLTGFIAGEAKSQGKPIDAAAADLLSFLIGNNLQELSSQIEKLVVFAGSRPRISIDDVRVIASDSKAFSVFELARFLGTQDLQNSLKSLSALFRNGEEAPMMVGTLARHFRQLWQIRELLDRKTPQAEIGREVGIAPYFLGEMILQARNFNRKRLLQLFEELCICDLASKTGGHPYTLLHELAVGICR